MTSSCRTGKVQYFNRKLAKARARALHDSAINAYRCDDCGWFHVGHKPQRVRNGAIGKDAWRRGGPPPAAPPRATTATPADMARLVGRRKESA